MRFWIWLITLSVCLWARENPFEPVITPQESGKVQEVQKPNYFTKEILSLPSTARKIRRIEVEYQNMDGSLNKVQVEIERDIDWHFPMVIMQDTDGTLIRDQQKRSTSIKAELIPGTPQKLPAAQHTPSAKKEFKAFSFITFELDGKTLFIRTADAKVRDFALSDPTKIVIDFSRNTTFYSKKITTDQMFFPEIALGNHKSYYRAAIKLDGKYRYTLSKVEGGYLISLK